MRFDLHSRTLAVRTSLALTTVAGTWAATVGVADPAAADALIKTFQTVTCSLSTACILGENSSTGPGVTGKSTNGFGVQGNGITGVKGVATKNYGVNGTSAYNDGVFGSSTASGGAGVAGTSSNGNGVYGYVTSGAVGVSGLSGSGYGLYGTTSSGGGYGVVGSVSGSGIGVYGASDSSYGLEAVTNSGDAVYGEAFGTGSAGYLSADSGGYGLISYANGTSGSGVALYGNSSHGNAADLTGTYIGIVARSPASSTTYPFVATDTNSNDLFYVDSAGDVGYHGGLFHFARIPGGALVKSYSPNTTEPTLEDTGTAQLVGGAAIVRLDPTFAASIDAVSSYRVFLTPNGDTRGLFVATKTANGFMVRESQGGRSTVSFDYRIVATSGGGRGQRMAVANPASEPRAAVLTPPHATANRLRAASALVQP